MTVLVQSSANDADAYARALRSRLPSLDVCTHPDIGRREDVRYAVVWSPPRGLLPALPNLRGVFNLGAGVDAILSDPDVPDSVPVYRLEDAGMADQMAGWVVHAVVRHHRRFDDYAAAQAAGRWQPLNVAPANGVTVGLMGLGVLGRATAAALHGLGYRLRGWSRRPRAVEGVEVHAGAEQFHAFLDGLDVLVCLLPLTPETRGLIDRDTLGQLAPGSAVINAARGAHIIEHDLLEALEHGPVTRAMLDVCDTEPLPPGHAFWTHPRITITPHIAALTLIEPACDHVADIIRRLERGDPPPPAVDRQAGY